MRSVLSGAIDVFNRAPVPYVNKSGIRQTIFRRQNKTAQMEAYGAVGTLFAIVDALAESVSQLEWDLWRSAETKEEREIVNRHAAKTVFEHPNDFYDQTTYVEALQQHWELAGEMWQVLYRVPGVDFPLEMWPVRPDRMEPIPSTTEFIQGYIYHGPGGEDVPLELDEVMFDRKPNPLDPYRGLSAVQSILADIDSSRLSAEWVRNFFYNSAEPGGIIEVDKSLQDKEFNRLRDRWNDQHKGVSRAHRVAILEQGKWVDRKFSMHDMQFNELRNVNRDIIREAFRMSKTILGIEQDVNRAASLAAETTYDRWLVVPRARRWRTVLNQKFLPLFGSTGEGVEFDFQDPVPSDPDTEQKDRTSKWASAKRGVEAGYDPAKVLESVGLPPMDWVGIPSGASRSSETETESQGSGAE